MTWLQTLVESAPSFRLGLLELLRLLPDHRDKIARSTSSDSERDANPPEGVSRDDWLLSTSVAHTLVDLARSGDDDGWDLDLKTVVQQVQQAEEEYLGASADDLVAFVQTLVPRSLEDLAVAARDGFLPVVESVKWSLDLRVAGDDTTGRVLAPLVVCRVRFDEAVGGSRAVTFQVPLRLLRQVTDEVQAIESSLSWARSTVPEEVAPASVWLAPMTGETDA